MQRRFNFSTISLGLSVASLWLLFLISSCDDSADCECATPKDEMTIIYIPTHADSIVNNAKLKYLNNSEVIDAVNLTIGSSELSAEVAFNFETEWLLEIDSENYELKDFEFTEVRKGCCKGTYLREYRLNSKLVTSSSLIVEK